jgi:hypothetical protein
MANIVENVWGTRLGMTITEPIASAMPPGRLTSARSPPISASSDS